ncbi:ABC transporter ATP-binding protein [soil metagenome]
MSTPLVQVDDVSHRFGDHLVLKSISLEIAPESFTVLLGPSGSGKTTLLSILGGFLTPHTGRVLIGDVDCTAMPPAQRPTTTVFQDYALFPHMSVADNVAFGLRMRGMARAQRLDEALNTLRLVGLEAMADRKPHQLSGGQRQRVALARALAVNPAVLLLDEPLGALDLKLRRSMQDELKALQHRVGTAFVHVTHDQEEAMALADHIVVMNDGRIEDEGPPERLYARPRTRFTATFMGESTLIEGLSAEAAGDRVRIETSLGRIAITGAVPPGLPVSIAIRPENIHVQKQARTLRLGEMQVTESIFQGGYRRILGEWTVGGAVICHAPPQSVIRPGDLLTLHARPDDMILLRE